MTGLCVRYRNSTTGVPLVCMRVHTTSGRCTLYRYQHLIHHVMHAVQRPAPGSKEQQSEADVAAAAAPDTNTNNNRKVQKGKKGSGQQGKQQAQQPQGWFELKNNTSIYINGLPDDVTVEEVHEACSKFGLIKEDDQRRPRIKLYK